MVGVCLEMACVCVCMCVCVCVYMCVCVCVIHTCYMNVYRKIMNTFPTVFTRGHSEIEPSHMAASTQPPSSSSPS